VLLAVVAAILLWKVLLTAGCLALVQWAVVTHSDDATVQFVAFALPALLVAVVIHRARTARRHNTAHATPFGRKGGL
jgi:membrane protein implicated in regulation of membrane protease activity